MEGAQQAYSRWTGPLSLLTRHTVSVGSISGKSFCACFWRLRVRNQLLLSYGLATVLVFSALFILCMVTTNWIRNAVVEDSLAALTNQVVHNSGLVLREAASALLEKFAGRLTTLATPTAYALTDVLAGVSSLSTQPSYSDGAPAYLRPPVGTHPRYTCLSSSADAAARGCLASGLQQISQSASSLYVTGSHPNMGNGFGLRPGAPGPSATLVDASTVMDLFVKETWTDAMDVVDVFLALGGLPSLFRQFPGAVGDLSADANGYRTYDPASRGWYTAAADLHPSDSSLAAPDPSRLPPERPMATSEPYLDRFGRGYMVTLSTLLVDQAGALIGVGGTDVHVDTLREMVTFIMSRETGEAHLFHVASSLVVASRQFIPGTTAPMIGTLRLPGLSGLMLQEVTPSIESQCASTSSGSFEWAAADDTKYQFVWLRLYSDSYCLVTVTPTEEIQRPIVSQLDTIDDAAAKLIIVVLVVSAICLVLVLACVCLMSFRLAKPLVATADESTKIVRNLGGDLFDGVKIEPAPKQGQFAMRQLLLNDPGEVASLRAEFIRIIRALMAKRQKKPPPVNPMYREFNHSPADVSARLKSIDEVVRTSLNGLLLTAPAADECPAKAVGNGNAVGNDVAVEAADEGGSSELVYLTKWNRIRSQFCVKLMLPMTIGLIFIIAYNSAVLSSNVDSWMAPVRATMVGEEFANLDVRAFERASFVEQYLASSIGTLTVLHNFAAQLLVDGSVPHGQPRTSYFSPQSLCDEAGVTSSTADITCTRPTTDLSSRHPVYRANYASSVVYAPPTRLPSSVKEPDTGVVVTAPGASGGGFADEQRLSSQLDNAFRAAYFASKITYAYMAYHETEAFRQFPYMRLDNFDYSRRPRQQCDAAPAHVLAAYTPLCRQWYTNAVQSWTTNGRVPTTTFNPVASDLVSPGELFLSLSKALSTPSGELVGVVAVDVALADLSAQLQGTQLYERGYAFVWDENGNGVVHKNYQKESNVGRGPVRVAELDAGDDFDFRHAFETNVVNQGRVSGNWSNYWHNPETGVDERWYYSFCPIQGTPYMMALTMVDQEVTAGADEEISKIKGWVRNQVLISVFLLIVALLLLQGFTWMFLKRFAEPVMRLHDLVAAWGDGNYATDIEGDLSCSASSQELRTISGNLSKLLVALRFGNPQYTKQAGRENEQQNTLKAFDIMGRALQSADPPAAAARGIGVVFNNLALGAAACKPEERAKCLEPGSLFGEAIQNVKELLAEAQQQGREADVAALSQTLSLRLLNKVLWLVEEDHRGKEAASCVQEAASCSPTVAALGTITSNLSWKSFACGVGGSKDPDIASAVEEAALRGLAVACKEPVPRENLQDFADVCLAVCDLGCPSRANLPELGAGRGASALKPAELAAWTLEHVELISSRTLTRLAMHAQELQLPGYQDALHRAMASEDPRWDEKRTVTGVAAWQDMSKAKPKIVLFVLDLSYSMQSDNRLGACKEALLSVLNDHCADKDRVGLISFADDVRYECPIAAKDYAAMAPRVKAMSVRGRTAFYSAVLKALQDTAGMGEPATPKWVVALTDGEDTSSRRGDLDRCMPLLHDSPNLNLALITVGNIGGQGGYDRLIQACSVGAHSNQGILINAANSAQISEAFGKVAEAMNAGVVEHL